MYGWALGKGIRASGCPFVPLASEHQQARGEVAEPVIGIPPWIPGLQAAAETDSCGAGREGRVPSGRFGVCKPSSNTLCSTDVDGSFGIAQLVKRVFRYRFYPTDG